MTAVAALPFPGGRTLAGWWRQLAPWRPQALWVAHLLVHKIEARVRLHRVVHADPVELMVLEGLKMALGMEMDRLDQHLHLGRQVLTQLLHNLNAAGLAESDGAGLFVLTALGHTALASGHYSCAALERRLFYFLAG